MLNIWPQGQMSYARGLRWSELNPAGPAMNDKIRQLMAKMALLEEDLRTALHEQESKMFFEIRGKRVEFESSVKAAHKKLQTHFYLLHQLFVPCQFGHHRLIQLTP